MKDGNFLDDLKRYIGRLALRVLLWSYKFPDQKSWGFYNEAGASIKMLLEFYKDRK